MVLDDGAVRMLGANACTVRTYSPTRANAHVGCNRVDGGGVGYDVISKDLWETNTCALIMC